MDWENVLAYVIETILGLVITVAIPYTVSIIKNKIDAEQRNASTEEKKLALEITKNLINRAKETVSNCVITINQTYVDDLKKEGKFTKEAQKQAFDTCKTLILSQLSSDAKSVIIDTFGTLEVWVKTQVEKTVNFNK